VVADHRHDLCRADVRRGVRVCRHGDAQWRHRDPDRSEHRESRHYGAGAVAPSGDELQAQLHRKSHSDRGQTL